MNHNIAYNLKCEIELNSGRKIILDKLDQERTYCGLLVGCPSTETNNRTIEHALNCARKKCIAGSEPALIAPVRKDYLRTPGDMARNSTFRQRPAEWLPAVQCTAIFHSITACRDLSKDGSLLVILWFQDEFALPIKSDILQKIHVLDWDTLAADYEY